MDGSQVATWVSAAAAAFSAIAALSALGSARASGKAARALTTIEASRRHEELTPEFRFHLSPLNPGGDVMRLTVEFVRPVALQRLRGLTVRIRDDRPGRDQGPYSMSGDGLSADEIRRQVWGPYRFTPLIGPQSNPADADGRVVEVSDPLDVGEGLPFQLEPTRPPWRSMPDAAAADAAWRDMVGSQLRLTITAHSYDGDPWVLPYEVSPDKS